MRKAGTASTGSARLSPIRCSSGARAFTTRKTEQRAADLLDHQMMRLMWFYAAAICLVPTLTAAPSQAQGYPFSQRGSVTQNVAFTTIAVAYGRPVARGRTLFGQLVPWDSVWHPGADSATRITFNHPVTLEGREVRAGEYSLWLIPRASGPWTLILSKAAHTFHKPYP